MRFLKFLLRLFLPSPAKHWDWKAAELREDWYSEEEIVRMLGPRPLDDA